MANLRFLCLVIALLVAAALLVLGMVLVWRKPAATESHLLSHHRQFKGLSLMVLGSALGCLGLHLCKKQ